MKKLTKDAINSHIGQRIYQRRKAMGFTQGEVARAIGLTSPQQVSAYEKAAAVPTLAQLFAIAEKLEAEIAYFFEGLPSDHATQPNSDPYQPRNDLETKILKSVRSCPRMVRDAILVVVCNLAGEEP